MYECVRHHHILHVYVKSCHFVSLNFSSSILLLFVNVLSEVKVIDMFVLSSFVHGTAILQRQAIHHQGSEVTVNGMFVFAAYIHGTEVNVNDIFVFAACIHGTVMAIATS